MTIKSYHEHLPENYFNGLYGKIKDKLLQGECILISVIYGFGNKTVFSFLNYQIEKNNLFDKIVVYDPEIERVTLPKFVVNILGEKTDKRILVVIRFFETLKNKNETLEKLDSLRRKDPSKLVFLAITDHTAITNPSNYIAKSTVFFSDRIYISPFTPDETVLMIKTLKDYYGWEIPKNNYKNIYEMSGGIPRLIKYVCKEIIENKGTVLQTKFDSIPINFQLNLLTKLLIKLSKNQLESLGILEKGKIKSKLLKDYFKNYQNEVVSQIFSNLTKQEQKLLTFLLENHNEVVSIDKIADLIQMSEDDFSLWAIYKLISRLKLKVKTNFNIKNLKGQGYVLQKI